MLIVLPPSQSKASPPPGLNLDLEALAFPGLNPVRKRILTALVRLCRADKEAAMSALGLGARQVGEVEANARVRTAPSAPAIEIYTGVLYEALDVGTLTAPQRRRLDAMVAISSALFGLVRPLDRIPAYRLSAELQIPGVPSLAQAWRPVISPLLEEGSGLVWDLRSAAYAGLGPAPASSRTVTTRILLERGGKRSVVSHHNKATKGRLVRGLACATGKARTPDDLADSLTALGYRCELHAPGHRTGKGPGNGPTKLDVIVTEV